jgi:hypothetical protein
MSKKLSFKLPPNYPPGRNDLTITLGTGLNMVHPTVMLATKRLIGVNLQIRSVQTLSLWIHTILSSVQPFSCKDEKSDKKEQETKKLISQLLLDKHQLKCKERLQL